MMLFGGKKDHDNYTIYIDQQRRRRKRKKSLLTKGMLALFDHKTLPRFDDNSPAAIRPGRLTTQNAGSRRPARLLSTEQLRDYV